MPIACTALSMSSCSRRYLLSNSFDNRCNYERQVDISEENGTGFDLLSQNVLFENLNLRAEASFGLLEGSLLVTSKMRNRVPG
jgi:hypothetical protein